MKDPMLRDISGEPIRDLPDFHLRWPEFRPAAKAALARMTNKEREIFVWLIALADRVGEADVKNTNE